MNVPKEARMLYLSAEIYLNCLDHADRPPDYLNADGKKGWHVAMANVRASVAEQQLRIATRNMLALLQQDDRLVMTLRADWEARAS